MKRLPTQHLDTCLFPCLLGLFRRCRPPPPPPDVPPKGQLRFRSPPGAFVFLGVLLVLIGLTVAVVGYWPHKPNSTSTSAPPTQPRPGAERLKLIGPVVMGAGLFIFICANTMLYENRDSETKRLMQNGVCGTGEGQRVPPQGTDPVASSTSHRGKSLAQTKWGDSSGELDNRRNFLIKAQLLRPSSNELSLSASLLSVRSDPCVSSVSQVRNTWGHVAGTQGKGFSSAVRLDGAEGLVEERGLVVPPTERQNRSWPWLDRAGVGYAKLDDATEHQLEEGTRDISQETVLEMA
ncbi:hypothetical protein FKM82_020373 [Ascaphus truei]